MAGNSYIYYPCTNESVLYNTKVRCYLLIDLDCILDAHLDDLMKILNNSFFPF